MRRNIQSAGSVHSFFDIAQQLWPQRCAVPRRHHGIFWRMQDSRWPGVKGEMCRPQASPRISLIAVLATALWAGFLLASRPFAADVRDNGSDEEGASPIDIATIASEAGATAGFAAYCNVGPSPLHAALHGLLHSAIADRGQRYGFW